MSQRQQNRESKNMRLTDLRKSQGLTQLELAKRAGLNRSQVAALEAKQRDIGGISLRTAIKLADALHVNNPRDLLD